MDQKHQDHTLGRVSSKEVPVKGVQPGQVPCPVCGRSFKTKSEMERHKDTIHHETKGHNE